jgi:hypothetical protein
VAFVEFDPQDAAVWSNLAVVLLELGASNDAELGGDFEIQPALNLLKAASILCVFGDHRMKVSPSPLARAILQITFRPRWSSRE